MWLASPVDSGVHGGQWGARWTVGCTVDSGVHGGQWRARWTVGCTVDCVFSLSGRVGSNSSTELGTFPQVVCVRTSSMRKVVWYVLCCVVFCQFLFRTFSPPLQSLGQATCNATVSLRASQGGERSRSGVADLLAEAQQLVEEVMLQGVASPHRLQTSECLTHTFQLST